MVGMAEQSCEKADSATLQLFRPEGVWSRPLDLGWWQPECRVVLSVKQGFQCEAAAVLSQARRGEVDCWFFADADALVSDGGRRVRDTSELLAFRAGCSSLSFLFGTEPVREQEWVTLGLSEEEHPVGHYDLLRVASHCWMDGRSVIVYQSALAVSAEVGV